MRSGRDNTVIVARKGIELYCFSALLQFEMHNEIKLSSLGAFNEKAERIVSLFKNLGIVEKERGMIDTSEENKIILFTQFINSFLSNISVVNVSIL